MSRVFKVDYIPDPDRGRPLWNAKIFVGVANQDPTIPSNQIQLTGDIGFPVGQSIPVPQPVRTNAGGITVYNNSPLDLNAPGQEYAIQIFDRNDNLIYNFPQVDGSVVMNTTSQEEVTGLTIWPEVGDAVIGQTIPAGTDAIRYPFNGRSTLFTIKPPVAVTGTITNITINSSGVGELEVDNSDVYDLAEFNSFIAANDGDSQLAGGNIWPLSSQDSAQVGDDLTGYSYVRLTGGDFSDVTLFPIRRKDFDNSPLSGTLDSINLTTRPYSITVGGTEIWIEDIREVNKPYSGYPVTALWTNDDGITDDFAQCSAALIAVNSGAGSLYFPKAERAISGTLRIGSNVNVDCGGSTFLDIGGGTFPLFSTTGAYDDLVSNITLKNFKSDGFTTAANALFVVNYLCENCESDNAIDNAFQSIGDYTDNATFINCISRNSGFHGFACNDSVNFDPANTRIGQRYPIKTTFVNCKTFNAGGSAFNVHSNEEGGMSTVRDCYAYNPDVIGKGTWGSTTWDNVTIVYEGKIPSTFSWQIGNTSDLSTVIHKATVKNCKLFSDSPGSFCLILGDCSIESNLFSYTGGNSINMFQLSAGQSIDIINNTFEGDAMEYGTDSIINDNSVNKLGVVTIKNNKWNNELSFQNISRNLFVFKDSSIEKLVIAENRFNTTNNGEMLAIQNNQCDEVVIRDNTAEEEIYISVTGTSVVSTLFNRDNNNIRALQRYPDSVIRNYAFNNTEGNLFAETTGTAGNETTAVKNFVGGEVYEMDITTDLSSTAPTFVSRALYSISVSRDSTGLVQAAVDLGNESNISAVFSLSGSDVVFSTSTATTHRVNVRRVGRL